MSKKYLLAIVFVWTLFVLDLFGDEPLSYVKYPILSLQAKEELVSGAIGLTDNDDIKYTLIVVRKPIDNPSLYNPICSSGNSLQIVQSGLPVPNSDTLNRGRFDYWVVFNGEKFGPYQQVEPVPGSVSSTDDWVTRDGKGVSFVGINGMCCSLVVGNHGAIDFQKSIKLISCDSKSGINTCVLSYNSDDYGLIEKGVQKLKGWRLIERVTYSDDGENLLYVGAKEKKEERYIYLNHKIIAGPYQDVPQLGFIPGSNQVYFAGCSQVVEGSEVVCGFGYVAIGNKRIIIPDDCTVGPFHFCNNRVSFSTKGNTLNVGVKNGVEPQYIVYEYNIATDKLVQHEGYRFLQTKIAGESFYYITCNSQGNSVLVKEGGAVFGGDEFVPRGDSLPGVVNWSDLALSDDGKHYALPLKEDLYLSFTEDKTPLRVVKGMVVDSSVLVGNFGVPVWSKKFNSFLVVRQLGNAVEVVGL